uniref:G2/mitotic-specific cyclin-B n=1 Tax=Aceria tosichella TaxID=561515 RepID=A0A6G1SD99_9ACAR
MLLNNRPKGISINKNALNIQINNGLQQPQQQQQQILHPLEPLKQSSRSPSPPQLKSLRQPSENDDLGQLLLKKQQQQLNIFEKSVKPTLIDLEPVAEQPVPKQKPPPLLQQQPLQTLNQGIKRERPKSLIPRLINEVEKKEEPVEDIDQPNGRDAVFMVCDVAKDIYDYMFELERSLAIKEDYLKNQKIFTSKVRHRLISWCVEINSTLKLLPETMYTTISILDRYFQNVIIEHQKQVQLIAISATLIASKYEEIYPPEIDDLTYLTQNAYTKRDVLRMEIEILEKLKFDLGKPIPLAFLRRFSKAAHCDLKMHSMAKYLMEISLPHYECAHWCPSLLAATALFITIYLIHHDNTFARWNKTLIHYTTYTRQQLMEPAATLCKILKGLPNPNPKMPELKSIYVDKLIKIGGQQKLERS